MNTIEGNLVAPKGMKVGIIASRFNEIIVGRERNHDVTLVLQVGLRRNVQGPFLLFKAQRHCCLC